MIFTPKFLDKQFQDKRLLYPLHLQLSFDTTYILFIA